MKGIITLLLIVSSYDLRLKYKFHENFGQKFHDYSGNGFDGINGETTAKDVKDTIPTDRGAYFYDSFKEIGVPIKNLNQDYLFDEQKFSVLFWVKIKSPASRFLASAEPQSKNNLFRRFLNSENYFSVFILPTGSIQLQVISDSKSFELVSSASMVWGTWQFVGVFLKKDEAIVTINLNEKKDSSNDIWNTNLNIGYTIIGGENENESFNGFLFSFQVLQDEFDVNDFVADSSSLCLTSGCNLNCSPAIKIENINYCLSQKDLITSDSSGTSCPSGCIYGCSQGTCLDCKCKYLSCTISNNLAVCWCDTSETPTVTDCSCGNDMFDGLNCITAQTCTASCDSCSSTECLYCQDLSAVNSSPSGTCACSKYYVSVNSACQRCKETCSSCSTSLSCIDCIALNASPGSSGECQCNSGYFAKSSLTRIYSCQKCNEECKSCVSNKECESCIALNAFPSGSGCKCKEGFYSITALTSSTSCQQCHSNCTTCSQALKCLTCNVATANPANIGCACPEYSSLVDDECVCESGFNLTQSSPFKCFKCHSSCETCEAKGENSCLTCKEGLNFINKTCNCEEEKFWNGTSCEDCPRNCLKCSRKNTCKDCKDRFELVEGKCIKNCSIGMFFNETQCFPCEKLCDFCDATNCTQCSANAVMNANGTCECSQGFQGLDLCKRVNFEGKLIIETVSTVFLIFDDDLKVNLTEFNVWFNNSQVEYSVTIYKIDMKTYLFRFRFKSNVPDNCFIFVGIVTDKEIESESNYLLLDYNFSAAMPSYTKPFISSQATQALANATSGITRAAIGSSFLSGVLSSPAFLWSFLNSLELIALLPLNVLPYPDSLKEFFNSFVGFSIFPNPMKYLMSTGKETVPYKEAEDYGFETFLYYFNAGTYIWIFIFITAVVLICYLGTRIRYYWVYWVSRKVVDGYGIGFFIRFWIQGQLDLGLVSAIQLHSSFSKTPEDIFSICLSIFTIILFILTPIFFTLISYLKYDEVKAWNNLSFKKRWGCLYEEFKNDKGFFSTLYYSVFALRRVEFVISQVYLNDYIYVQSILNIITTVLHLGYIIVFNPFKEREVTFCAIFGEVCTAEVMIISMFFINNEGTDLAVKLETAIVISVIITILVQVLVSIFLIFKGLREKWKKCRGRDKELTMVESVQVKITPDNSHIFKVEDVVESFDGCSKVQENSKDSHHQYG